MRGGTSSAPGLGDKINGQIDSILGEWKIKQKRDMKERDDSASANKRKKIRIPRDK